MSKKDKKKKKDSQDESQDQIEKMQSHIDDLTNDIKRIQADFVNYRKRAEEDKTNSIRIGKRLAVESLLPVLDNIERALGQVPEDLSDNTWAKGVSQVAKQTKSVLKDMGVKKIDSEGKEFDPNLHEAVDFEDGDGEEVIAEVMQPGYMMGEDVIRPAMVKVSKKTKEEK